MWKYLPTVIAGLLCVLAIAVSRYPYVKSGVVSPETVQLAMHRAAVMEQRASYDGAVTIFLIATPTSTPLDQKIANHPRTLRAYIFAHGAEAENTLFIDQAKPHETFFVKGPFSFPENDIEMRWVGTHKLMFEAHDVDGNLRRYVLDVLTPALSLLGGM